MTHLPAPPDPSTGDRRFRTAARHASTRVPVAGLADRAGQVRAAMSGQRFDTAAVVAVCDDDGRLEGLVTVEALLAAPPQARLREIMDPRPPAVSPATNQDQATAHAIRHGHPAIAVVDGGGRFRGIIPPQRLLSILLAEHQEDLSRLGGVLHSADPARAATLESVPRRLWHRLPWLGLGLAGAMLSAALMNTFEHQLSDLVLIAFFIPGIVYLADAVGTQTETIAIRGLPLGVSIRRIAGREALTGVIIGLLLGGVLLPLIAVVWGDLSLAVAVAIAVFAASAVATLVAMALPWLLYRSGRDPAFGSGPLATVVQDLLSLGIYLAVAVLLVG